jgi:hypothetical protein
MHVIAEDHYCPKVIYMPGNYTFRRDEIGTRYVCIPVRTLVYPNNPEDLDQVHGLQDAIKLNQSSSGRFEVPEWDKVRQKEVCDALSVLGSTLPDSKSMFGTKEQIEAVRHLIGSAVAWGGNPETEATNLNFTPLETTARPFIAAESRTFPSMVLVYQRLQLKWLLRTEPAECVFAERYYCDEGERRLSRQLRAGKPFVRLPTSRPSG